MTRVDYEDGNALESLDPAEASRHSCPVVKSVKVK
jgi:hypothetical protein